MKYEDIRPTIQTGDIVLSSGNSTFAGLLKNVYGHKLDHAAIAIWGEHLGKEPGRLYVWEAVSLGVGDKDFAEACATPNVDFLSRVISPGAGDVMIRHLYAERTPEILVKIKLHCDLSRGLPYKRSTLALLRAVPWVRFLPFVPKDEDLASQFCYEAAASLLQSAGWLSRVKPADYYSILDFVGAYMPLVGCTLSDLIPVEFP